MQPPNTTCDEGTHMSPNTLIKEQARKKFAEKFKEKTGVEPSKTVWKLYDAVVCANELSWEAIEKFADRWTVGCK